MNKYGLIFLLMLGTYMNLCAQQPSLMNVKTWAYQLQNMNIPQTASNNTFELLVTDYSSDGTDAGKFTPQEIAQIKNNGKKAISYLSIGEAEDYRYYWQSSWNTTPPAFLGPENSNWPGNFKVLYWDTAWQNIIFSYLDTIIQQGFDGVYLDIIDAYYYWMVDTPPQPLADSLMIQFVLNIRNHISTVTNDTFYILPQNAEEIINSTNVSPALKAAYFSAINAVGVEDVFFFGNLDEDNPFNPDTFRVQQLKEYLSNGKQVFSIEYLTQTAKIQQYATAAQNENFVPFACVRALDNLCNQITVGIPSAESKKINEPLAIFPHPVHLTADLQFPAAGCTFNIFDSLGKLVYQKTPTERHETLTLNLPGGIYFYQLRDKDQIISRGKLIVQ